MDNNNITPENDTIENLDKEIVIASIDTDNLDNIENIKNTENIEEIENKIDDKEKIEIQDKPKSQFKSKKKSKKPNFFVTNLFDWTEIIVYAIVIAILLLTLIVKTGTVDGTSMYPTMNNDDRYLLSNLFYSPVQRDIVVFCPETEPDKLYVKRVIAIAGQTIDINDDGEVLVDGVILEEDYIGDYKTGKGSITLPLTVPEGYIFVMGDNRSPGGSLDSRFIGCIDTRRVVGKLLLRIYPVNKFGLVN